MNGMDSNTPNGVSVTPAGDMRLTLPCRREPIKEIPYLSRVSEYLERCPTASVTDVAYAISNVHPDGLPLGPQNIYEAFVVVRQRQGQTIT